MKLLFSAIAVAALATSSVHADLVPIAAIADTPQIENWDGQLDPSQAWSDEVRNPIAESLSQLIEEQGPAKRNEVAETDEEILATRLCRWQSLSRAIREQTVYTDRDVTWKLAFSKPRPEHSLQPTESLALLTREQPILPDRLSQRIFIDRKSR